MNRGISILVVTACLLAAMTTAQAADLYDPPATTWGCELSDGKVLQGITSGLLSRGWIVTSNDNKGKLVAQIVVRGKHTLVIDITYNTSSFDINYKSSNNLKYSEKSNGTKTIHRNANSWIQNVNTDIARQLSALCNLSN